MRPDAPAPGGGRDAQARHGRDAFRLFRPIPTRWHDNDAYGHVNNVVYYSYFDTAVNAFLVEAGLLDIAGDAVIAVVAETGCRYFESAAFPEPLEAGLAVAAIGRASICYRIGIFRALGELAAAQGHFVHVYVERATGRSVAVPERVRAVLDTLRA